MTVPLDAQSRTFFAILNPAAGGGRSAKLAPAILDRVRKQLPSGSTLEVAKTERAGHATELARGAYAAGYRNFLAMGGDGTAFEIVNGIFPQALTQGRASLGLLPLGTGNSFLRDFTNDGVEHTMRALAAGQSRFCDVICARHTKGELYFINLLSLGFPADVGQLTNQKFKKWGEFGYVAAVFGRLANLDYHAFPHRTAASAEWDRRPCLFLAFSNSKFTGGKMMIAPNADATDGQIECVRWGPVGPLRLVWTFPRLFTGSHIHDPIASRASAPRVEFDLKSPATAMIDGEIMDLELRSLEVLPGALDVIV